MKDGNMHVVAGNTNVVVGVTNVVVGIMDTHAPVPVVGVMEGGNQPLKN